MSMNNSARRAKIEKRLRSKLPITTKADMQHAAACGIDHAQIMSKITRLQVGEHHIQSIGAFPDIMTPLFHYACTTDDRIWRIDDENHSYVENMIALAHSPWKIKPFPCVAICRENGLLAVEGDETHMTKDREDCMRADPTYDAQVAAAFFSIARTPVVVSANEES